MNTLLPNPIFAPHLLRPSRSQSPSANPIMTSRKRKQDEDHVDGDTPMSRSPSGSPSLAASSLPAGQKRNIKRPRTNATGRPLNISRLLETLDANGLRTLLKTLCDKHPQLLPEVASVAPRPTIESVILVLDQYESTFLNAFPFGSRPESEYAYNRVKQQLVDYLDALKEYTPNFLPPNEQQTGVSLDFLNHVTNMVHRLPNWDNVQNHRHKEEAYDEISKAWANVVREAAKRGGGIQLRMGGWDQKIMKHNETSGDRLQDAVQALTSCLNWMDQSIASSSISNNNNTSTIREQLLNGTYGEGLRATPW